MCSRKTTHEKCKSDIEALEPESSASAIPPLPHV